MRKSVIVSNRLPLQISKLENSFLFQPSSGGLATGLDSVHKNNDSIWVGWSGITSEGLTKKNKLEIKNTLDDLRLVEVELNQKEVDEFYYGLSNKCIWPLFHYFIELAKFNENDWLTYVNVNKKFCCFFPVLRSKHLKGRIVPRVSVSRFYSQQGILRFSCF